MSRDFILVFSGGMVSLLTTLVVLFVADYIYRRQQKNGSATSPAPSEGVSELALPEKLTSDTASTPQEKIQPGG